MHEQPFLGLSIVSPHFYAEDLVRNLLSVAQDILLGIFRPLVVADLFSSGRIISVGALADSEEESNNDAV